jgi:hypothetical protein
VLELSRGEKKWRPERGDFEIYLISDVIFLLGKAKLVAGNANLERAGKLCNRDTGTFFYW